MNMKNKTVDSTGTHGHDKASDEGRMSMTQRDLINYCNNAPTDHCHTGCPYIYAECAAYKAKYDDLPNNEDLYNPQRYTDELIAVD